MSLQNKVPSLNASKRSEGIVSYKRKKEEKNGESRDCEEGDDEEDWR
jgi:hypothetical protein